MWSKIKIFGHPVHPMVIAYPIAFYTGTLAGFLTYAATDDPFWLKATIVANVVGVVMAAVAALPGFVDWLLGIPRGSDAKRTGLVHGLLNVVALVLFLISMIAYVGSWDTPTKGAGLGIVLSAIGVGVTLAAGWYGWTLVQGHHVGIDLTQEQQRVDLEQEGLRRAG